MTSRGVPGERDHPAVAHQPVLDRFLAGIPGPPDLVTGLGTQRLSRFPAELRLRIACGGRGIVDGALAALSPIGRSSTHCPCWSTTRSDTQPRWRGGSAFPSA